MFSKSQLLSAGFIETTYEGQEGVFYTKIISTPQQLAPHYFQEEFVPDTCLIEYLPDGGLQYMLDFDLGAFDRFDEGEEGYKMLINFSGLQGEKIT